MTAQTILSQLGGNKFIAMTGAHSLSYEKNALVFKLRKNKGKFFAVKIELTPADEYKMTFFFWEKKFHLGQEIVDGVYCDQLCEIFTDKTGLATSL